MFARAFFIVFTVLFCFTKSSSAQCPSLVPNGGFEENAGFPADDCSWALATGWTNAATSSDCNSNNGTPDYFHLQGVGELSSLPVNYFSELLPFEGEAVMGLGGNLSFLPDAREYISITLSSPLVVGNQYTLSFSMTNGIPQVGGMYADGWGVLLSTGVVLQPVGTNGLIDPAGNLFEVPGVFSSQEWQTFTFDFIADQPYDQLTFGNFLDDANQTTVMYGVQEFISLSYVFVDDFVLETSALNAPILDLGADVELCSNTIVLDAATQDALSYTWNTGDQTSSITVSNPGLYFVDVEWTCGIISDSIVVSSCSELSLSLGPDIEICQGENITLSATTIGGLQPYSFEWNFINSPNAGTIEITPQTDASISLTVTDANGNTATDDVFVSVLPNAPALFLGEDQVICPGESVLLEIESNEYNAFLWSTGTTASSLLITEPGEYAVVASSPCNTTEDTILFINGELFIPSFSPVVSICEGEEIAIGPLLETNELVTWTDNSIAPFPRSIDEVGVYMFSVIDDCSTRTFEVEVNSSGCSCDIYIPNSFTPNNDGINDYFSAEFDCAIMTYDLRIYTRWGEEVFRSLNPNEKWTGAANSNTAYFAQDGVYNWVLEIATGSMDEVSDVKVVTGNVTLLR